MDGRSHPCLYRLALVGYHQGGQAQGRRQTAAGFPPRVLQRRQSLESPHRPERAAAPAQKKPRELPAAATVFPA